MSKNYRDLGAIAQVIADDIEAMGQTTMYAMLSLSNSDSNIDIRLGYNDAEGVWRTREHNELVATRLLDHFPGSTLKRVREYGQPAEISIAGSINGEPFEIKVGTGVEQPVCDCDHCKAEHRA